MTLEDNIEEKPIPRRKINNAMKFLDDVSERLKLREETKKYSEKIYRDIVNKKGAVGKTIKKVIAVSIYVAVSKYNELYTLSDIANAAAIKKSEIMNCYKSIKTVLGSSTDLTIEPKEPIIYVSNICSKLNLSEEITNEAEKITKFVQKSNISYGKSPIGIAATATYIAAHKYGKKITKKNVAEISGITAVTIRKNNQEIIYNVLSRVIE